MSLFNFNPSGFLGSGAFALDPSKFNFSNISVPSTTPDPMDIVAPEPEPEVKYSQAILDVMGDVKPDTEADAQVAIDKVKGKQPEKPSTAGMLGVDFSVPTTTTTNIPTSIVPQVTDVPSVIGEDGKYQSAGDISIANVGAVGFDSGIADVGTPLGDIQQGMFQRDIQLGNQLESFNTDTLSSLGVSKIDNPMLSNDNKIFVQKGSTESEGGFSVPTTVTAFNVSSDYIDLVNNLLSSDEASQYAQSMTDKASDFFGDNPDEMKTEYNALDFIKGMGLGGDNAFAVGGKYGGYSLYEYNPETNQFEKTLDKESSAIDAALPVIADAIQSSFYSAVLTAGIGELAGNVKAVGNIKKTHDIVKAVEEDDFISAITGALDLADLGTPQEYLEGLVDSNFTSGTGAISDWALNNKDHIAEATLKFTDKLLQGEGIGDSLQSAVVTYIKDEGGFSDLIPEGSGFDFDTPEFIEQIGDIIVEGASQLNSSVIRPVLDTAEELGEGAINTVTEFVEDTAGDVKDFYKTEVEPTIESNFNQIKDFYKTEFEPSIEDGINFTKDTLAEFDDNILQPIKNTGEDIIKFIDSELSDANREIVKPLVQQIEDVVTYVGDGLSDFNKETVKPLLQGIEDTISDLGDVLGEGADYILDAVNSLFEMIEFGGETRQTIDSNMQIEDREEDDSIVTVELLEPELVEGFDLSNPFFRGKV